MLAACERLIRAWPVAARIAFRDAVLADVSTFSAGDWDRAGVQIAAEIFVERWRRGLSWPPSATELVPAPELPAPGIDQAEVIALAGRICALGTELAVVCAPDHREPPGSR